MVDLRNPISRSCGELLVVQEQHQHTSEQLEGCYTILLNNAAMFVLNSYVTRVKCEISSCVLNVQPHNAFLVSNLILCL